MPDSLRLKDAGALHSEALPKSTSASAGAYSGSRLRRRWRPACSSVCARAERRPLRAHGRAQAVGRPRRHGVARPGTDPAAARRCRVRAVARRWSWLAAGLLLRSFCDLGTSSRDSTRTTSCRCARGCRTERSGHSSVPDRRRGTPFFRTAAPRADAPGVMKPRLAATLPRFRSTKRCGTQADLRRAVLVTFDGRAGSSEPPGPSNAPPSRRNTSSSSGFRSARPALRRSDIATSPSVAVVNEAFARTYWPSADPIGKRFRRRSSRIAVITVVGVIANARRSRCPTPASRRRTSISTRTAGSTSRFFFAGRLNAAAIPDAVRQQVQAIDPALPVFGAQMLDEVVAASLAARRFSMEMVALFGLTALVLAALGIYGVISYMVAASDARDRDPPGPRRSASGHRRLRPRRPSAHNHRCNGRSGVRACCHSPHCRSVVRCQPDPSGDIRRGGDGACRGGAARVRHPCPQGDADSIRRSRSGMKDRDGIHIFISSRRCDRRT